jgi:hypothetical protein
MQCHPSARSCKDGRPLLKANRQESTQCQMLQHSLLLFSKGLKKIMEADAQEGKCLKLALSRKRFSWGNDAHFLLGVGLSEVPGVRHYTFEQLLPLVYAALFVEAKVPFDPETFARSLPSDMMLASITEHAAADFLALQQKEVQQALHLHLGADKGNHKGVDHFVKVLLNWCKQSSNIKNYILDTDGCGSKSKDAAAGIEHSLKIVSGSGQLLQLASTATDSSGGGVLESLVIQLDGHNLSLLQRFIASCNLLGIQ